MKVRFRHYAREHEDTDLQELHRKVDSVRLTVGDLEVTRPCSTSSEDDGIILSTKLVRVDVLTNVCFCDEGLSAYNQRAGSDKGNQCYLQRPQQPSGQRDAGQWTCRASCCDEAKI